MVEVPRPEGMDVTGLPGKRWRGRTAMVQWLPALLAAVLILAAASLAAQENPLDRFLDRRLEKTKLPYPKIDDLTFIRRVWLDITGDLPYQSYLDEWLAQDGPVDRTKIVEEALNSRLYQSRWATYFDAMFEIRRLEPTSRHYRYSFRSAIREFLKADTGWDEVVRDLITYQGRLTESQGYYMAWHQGSGVNNTLMLDVFDDQAGYLTDKLLGIQMRCISCHDGVHHLEKVNRDLTARKRRDFWGLAAFLSTGTLFCPEGNYCVIADSLRYHLYSYVQVDDPEFRMGPGEFMPPGMFAGDGAYLAESTTGEGMRPPRNGGTIQPRYPFNGAGPLPGELRRPALARILTADRQFARNMVNRLWHHFIGTPFVWPYNDWDLARLDAEVAHDNNTTVQPADPEMLEYLTDMFIAGDYRLKSFIRDLCTSRIYQLDYTKIPPGYEGAYWGGPARLRRLEPEAVVTAIEWAAGAKPVYLIGGGSVVQSNPWDFLQEDPTYNYSIGEPPDIIKNYGIETAEQLREHQKALSDFLLGMGRGNRDDQVPAKAAIDQEAFIFLMNAKWLLNDILDRSPVIDDLHAQWQAGSLSADEVIERIYLRSLFRLPSPEEKAESLAHLAAADTRAAVAEIMWTCFNSVDFLYR